MASKVGAGDSSRTYSHACSSTLACLHAHLTSTTWRQLPAGRRKWGPTNANLVSLCAQASWRIYKDPYNALANSSSWRAFWSAFSTFNLAIMGSSVLPMPYAISKTGVLVGMLTMLLVALCNDYTTCLTISAAYTTGLDSFEALAYWAGGRHWQVSRPAVVQSSHTSRQIAMTVDIRQCM